MDLEQELINLHHSINSCSLCSSTDRLSPPVPFSYDNPNSKYMIIGRSPGNMEFNQGLPFVGPGGKLLWQCLDIPRSEFIVANTCYCFFQGDRAPSREYFTCFPHLKKLVDLVKPKLIMIQGNDAVRQFLRDPVYPSLTKSNNTIIFDENNKRYLHLLHHVGYIIRKPDMLDWWKFTLKNFATLFYVIKSIPEDYWNTHASPVEDWCRDQNKINPVSLGSKNADISIRVP